MAAPQWITKAGSLGIAVELDPFSIDLRVQTGDARAQFALISGQLPPGLRLSPRGNVSGYPIGKLSGVPLAVNEEIVFTFVIRCTNERGELADRTFSITVTGQDEPIPATAPFANNSLGEFNDGEWIEIDLSAVDTDPGDTLTYRVVSGDIPTGLTLDPNTGQITGYIEPGIFILDTLGFDTDNFDTVGFDQQASLTTRTYNFEIQIDDTKTPVIAAYSITVNKTENHLPILLNRDTDIGTVLDENYFFYKFQGRDFDGDSIGFEILPIVRYPTIVGSVVNPVVTANSSLSINGENIVTTGTTVQSVADDINAASFNSGNLTNISSEVRNGKILIFSSGAANSTISVGNTTVATELGITDGVYNRNVSDTNLDITQDLTEIVPDNLELNPATGWLYGFIDPLTVGEKVYDFYLRVYETQSEVGNATVSVNYASEFPFSVINNKSQSALDELALDTSGTNYINRTLIFAQQEGFDATYTGLDGTVFTTGASDGWQDPNSVVIPGYSSTPNKRGGVWRFVKSVDRLVTSGNTTGNTNLTFGNVNTLVVGMEVTGANIASNTVINSINTTSNVVVLSQNLTGTVSANAVISFNSSNYQLDFAQTVSTDTVVNVGKYTTTGNTGYTQPGVKLYYETAAAPPNTEPRYIIASDNANSSLWPQRLTVTSSNNYQIDWITDSDLGSTTSGVPSKLSVQAVNQAQTELIYTLNFVHKKTVFGSYNQSTIIKLRDVEGIVPGLRLRTADQNYTASLPLIISVNTDLNTIQLSQPVTVANNTLVELVGTDLPRGLELTSNGDIQGRVSHQHWKLNDNTTFDTNQTTFDRTYIIPIKAIAYLNDPVTRQIESVKTFTITVQDFKDQPSNNLYLDFLLKETDRQQLINAVYNDNIVPDHHVYRHDDHWFGRQDRLKMLVAYGLDVASADEIMTAVQAFHHKKRYRFTELKWAQSLDAAGAVEYEVIYIQPVDDFTLTTGAQLTGNIDVGPLDIPLDVKNEPLAENPTLYDATNDLYTYLYPASNSNVQNQLRRKLSPNNRKFLPSWMTSKQPDNRTLNFVKAIPLVYVKPGTGKLALYKMQQALNVIDLHGLVDRYYWDNGLAENYDLAEAQFIDDPLTTFDQAEIDPVDYSIVSTVDFAVEAPFYKINNSRARDLKSTGLLDGYRGDINGKTLVFFRQENYASIDDFQSFDGWANIDPQFDDDFGNNYETFQVVTGKNILDNLPASVWTTAASYSIGNLVAYDLVSYVCIRSHTSGISFERDFFAPVTSTSTYQQTGVWRIVEDAAGVVQLQFVSELYPKLWASISRYTVGDLVEYNSATYICNTDHDSDTVFEPSNFDSTLVSVRVRSGLAHGGSVISLVQPAALGVGFTVPGFINQAEVLASAENGTIFDSSTTEFFSSNTDQYQKMDQGAKYIVFKKQTLIDRGTVDV